MQDLWLKASLSLCHIPEQTVSCALLVTEPCSFVAVQVKIPESSGKVSAITSVHISSGNRKIKCIINYLKDHVVFFTLYVKRTPESRLLQRNTVRTAEEPSTEMALRKIILHLKEVNSSS